MPKLIRQSLLSTFFHPLLYGRAVKRNQVVRHRNTEADQLLAVTVQTPVANSAHVFELYEGGAAPDYDLTEEGLAQPPSPVPGGMLIVTGLQTNSLSAASQNTDVLLSLAERIGSAEFARMRLIFPDGDIAFNNPVVWRCAPFQSRNSNSQVEAVWPSFESEGTTTFIWTGGQVNGGHWRFEHAATGFESVGLRFKNIRWAGPGMSVASTAVATSAVGNSATSVQVADPSIFVVGDAIAISANPLTGGDIVPTSRPHWATVVGVVGSTVNFLPATPSNFFVASVGNRVQRWKQTRAVEIGGQSPDRQDVFINVQFDHCAWIDYFAGVATQDTTGITFDSHCRWAFCKFGVEAGYNNDSMILRMPFMQCQRQSQSGAVTSGSRVVTGLSTAQFKVGMCLVDNTDPLNGQAFPEWAVIESIDSPSQVTMTHASTLTGTRTLQPQMGWLVAMGSGHSPWYPREIAPYDGSRANVDQTVIENPLMSMGEGLAITDGASSSNVELLNIYTELSNRVLFSGNQLGTSNYGPYKITGQVKIPASMGPPVEICGPGQNVEVSQCFNDAGLRFPFVFVRGSSTRHSIKWSQNNLQTTYPGLIRPNTFFFGGISPGPAENCVIDIQGAQPSGLTVPVTLGGGTFNIETAGLDGLDLTLNASTTLANPPNWPPVRGKRFTIHCRATGSFTLTLGSSYVRQNGTAIGAMAGTVNTSMVAEFIGDGARWVLVGGTLASGVPAFV